MTKRTYATPAAFKEALEHRLRAAAGSSPDLARRRQLLVFDRFLARVVHTIGEAAMLKGGLVLELRLSRARTTKDVDLRFNGSPERVLAVKELGDASVPFPFDVHAMIFSENAPELENALHRRFGDQRLNLVNERKEFFHVSLADIESAAAEYGAEVEFTKLAEAEEYRRTMSMRAEKAAAGKAPDTGSVVQAKERFQALRERWEKQGAASSEQADAQGAEGVTSVSPGHR